MADEIAAGYSSHKREVLLLLKRERERSLQEIADHLHVTRVAALRHLVTLEADGLVERAYRPSGVGRPRVFFRLAPSAGTLFPQAYTNMSVCALQFIERRLGRPAVVELLQERARDLTTENRGRFAGATLAEDVRALARLRQEGGYMAEVGARRRSSVELLEHNCPILAIAQQFPEACEVERRMFESLLRARVDVDHRVVAGDPVCRFTVRAKEAPT